MKMRKKIEAGIKLRAALEAYKGEKTMAEIGSKYGVHPNMVTRWKHELLENGVSIFDSRKDQSSVEKQEKIDELHKNIGELKKNWKFWNKGQDRAL
jgi:transposase